MALKVVTSSAHCSSYEMKLLGSSESIARQRSCTEVRVLLVHCRLGGSGLRVTTAVSSSTRSGGGGRPLK